MKEDSSFWKKAVKERAKKMMSRIAKQALFIIGTKILEGIIEWAIKGSRKVQRQFDLDEDNYEFREMI